ncbi:hypothetical protein MKW98_030519 [Papaver atlanticum]|uniref:Uncharacterized protein n=1 Tax=Papaver atlanticum TaxID=357466 RepID=A0AAD4T932_9MAGN|nr:hypothetical protein MKW98_030519 [Papaver atlanticum]
MGKVKSESLATVNPINPFLFLLRRRRKRKRKNCLTRVFDNNIRLTPKAQLLRSLSTHSSRVNGRKSREW